MPERQAQDIAVGEFREILLWPFELAATQAGSAAVGDTCGSAKDALTASGRWRRVADPLRHLRPESPEGADIAEYQEFVYFHPFVRHFLYGAQADSPVALFHRPDIRAVCLELHNGVTGAFTVTLPVARLNLYILSCGIAVLALEIASGSARDGQPPAMVETPGGPRPLSLAHAQVILEQFRRVYPPYWQGDRAGLCPMQVGWIGENGSPDWHCMPNAADCAEQVDRHRQPPLAAHWRALLEPLGMGGDAAGGRHVVDERMPAMAYVAVDDPRAISRGDWVRLALLDEAGSGALPYGAAFLADFEQQHCHDAFWDPAAPDKTTRHLMSGYGFLAVGGTGDPFFARHAADHLRRHYFQLGLIAHMQSAALLSLSDRLAQAVRRPDDHAAAQAILGDVIDFTHRYWFPQVSGHVQARALYDRWRRHLGVDVLYTEVMAEAQSLTAFLNGKAESRRAEEAQRLNRIAITGLIPAIATGFLGMNVLIKADGAGKWISDDISDVVKTFAATAVIFVAIIWLMKKVPQWWTDWRQ